PCAQENRNRKKEACGLRSVSRCRTSKATSAIPLIFFCKWNAENAKPLKSPHGKEEVGQTGVSTVPDVQESPPHLPWSVLLFNFWQLPLRSVDDGGERGNGVLAYGGNRSQRLSHQAR